MRAQRIDVAFDKGLTVSIPMADEDSCVPRLYVIALKAALLPASNFDPSSPARAYHHSLSPVLALKRIYRRGRREFVIELSQ